MTPERWQRVEALYQSALGLEPDARAAYLSRECADDTALLGEVEALLREDARGDRTINEAIQRAAGKLIEARAEALIGEQLGAWRLVRRIAEGGMGSVYLGERCDGQFEQRAAVKLLNPALLSSNALARFNSERQILARLSHPNVARLYDGGTTDDGVPYLVMEYIEGAAINDYCREQQLGTRARLDLFNKLCAAVDYAHRNLVVHGDLKPSNVLVDTLGEPKLLDFGVARLVDREQAGAAVTVLAERMLTPRYASPEQLKGEAVTTATDVYSLGVLLYELLSGHSPYGASESSSHELHEAILGTTPPRLRGELAGDLDNIVLMALRKEPERRYGTAQQLADDIRRHLAHQPVLARPDTLAYRTRKFARRNRTALIVAGAVVALVVGQTAFYTTRLISERASSEAIARFLESTFEGANPFNEQGKVLEVRDLLDAAAARIDTEPAGQPEVMARLLHVIAATYLDIDVREEGTAMMRRALAMRRGLYGENSLPVAQSKERLGAALAWQGQQTEEATKLLREALATRRAKLGPTSYEVAHTLWQLGGVERIAGHEDDAQRLHEEAKQILEKLGLSTNRLYGHLLLSLSSGAGYKGDYPTQERHLRRALEVYLAAAGPTDPDVATAYADIATSLTSQRRYAEAEEFFSKALALKREIHGPHASAVEETLAMFGRMYVFAGQYDKAEPPLLEAVEIARKSFGENHVYYAYDVQLLARLRAVQRRFDESDQLYRTVIGIYESAAGPDYFHLGPARVHHGRMLVAARRFAQARTALQAAIEFYERNPRQAESSEGHNFEAMNLMGATLAGLGQDAEAEPLLVSGFEGILKMMGPDYAYTREARERVIAFHERRGDKATADKYRVSGSAVE